MATNRKRSPYQSGTITNNPLAAGGTTLNSAALANLPAVAAPDIMAIVLDPTGVGGNPEIVWVTAHTASATSATISRGQEGTTGRSHVSGTAWAHIPTINDFLPEYTTNDKYKVLSLKLTEDGYEWVSPFSVIQNLIRRGEHRSLCILGPYGSYPVAQGMGIGWAGVVGGSAGLTVEAIAINAKTGLWKHTTGATSGSASYIQGPLFAAVNDFTMEWSGYLDSLAAQEIFIGADGTAFNPTDSNDRIGFRITNTGTIVGVCDNGGVETTRDSGFTPNVATRRVLRIEVRSGGTIVRFYVDGSQIGADVTTNIHTSNYLTLGAGIINSAAADKVMYTEEMIAYCEVA